mgnify:CR=1 FL=1
MSNEQQPLMFIKSLRVTLKILDCKSDPNVTYFLILLIKIFPSEIIQFTAWNRMKNCTILALVPTHNKAPPQRYVANSRQEGVISFILQIKFTTFPLSTIL